MNFTIPYQRSGGLLALAILLLVSVGSYLHLERIKGQEVVAVDVESLPKHLGRWKGQDTRGLDIRSQEILKLSRYVKRAYTREDGATVILYIGYWEEQSGDYQAAKHSPLLCLPSNGWDVQRKDAIDLSFTNVSGAPLHAKRLIGNYKSSSQLFYYWFFTGDENYSEEWRALITIGIQKFLTGRSDGGIVEISTSLPTGVSRESAEEAAAEVIEDFLDEFYPQLNNLILNTKNNS